MYQTTTTVGEIRQTARIGDRFELVSYGGYHFEPYEGGTLTVLESGQLLLASDAADYYGEETIDYDADSTEVVY